MARLAYYISRCTGTSSKFGDCALRRDCLRYLCREAGRPLSFIFPGRRYSKWDECPLRIPKGTCGRGSMKGRKPVPEGLAEAISRECDAVKEFLLAKNRAYGDSASKPLRIFSRADPLEQIRVRIDDKLSRIARGAEFGTDDTVLDLIGYLILLRALSRPSAPSEKTS